jgi:hypothetical protein
MFRAVNWFTWLRHGVGMEWVWRTSTKKKGGVSGRQVHGSWYICSDLEWSMTYPKSKHRYWEQLTGIGVLWRTFGEWQPVVVEFTVLNIYSDLGCSMTYLKSKHIYWEQWIRSQDRTAHWYCATLTKIWQMAVTDNRPHQHICENLVACWRCKLCIILLTPMVSPDMQASNWTDMETNNYRRPANL